MNKSTTTTLQSWVFSIPYSRIRSYAIGDKRMMKRGVLTIKNKKFYAWGLDQDLPLLRTYYMFQVHW